MRMLDNVHLQHVLYLVVQGRDWTIQERVEMITVRAEFSNGLLRPLEDLDLQEERL